MYGYVYILYSHDSYKYDLNIIRTVRNILHEINNINVIL